MKETDVRIKELPNGIRVLHQYFPYTRTVHCGFIIDAGSRDDLDSEMGMAHFIEHMIFKGTPKRKTFHILNYLESVGGDLNAYTTKEKTAIYASLPAGFATRASDLLTDITFHSTFPEKEIVKEKQVIGEEIDMYREMPDEAIFEDFDEIVFPGHMLGKPILGSKESIQKFDREGLLNYVDRHYTEGKIIFAVVGAISDREVARITDRYLKDLKLPGASRSRKPPEKMKPRVSEIAFGNGQAHEILGGTASPLQQGHYFPFLLMNNLLGGPAMNSRLNLNIREKFGLTYNINSFYAPFLDSGIWGIYYSCEPGNLRRIRRLVYKELKTLRNNKLGVMRLSQAKKQLIGQLTLAGEYPMAQMMSMAKDLLDFDRIVRFDEAIRDIESISEADIMDAANEMASEECLSRISYLPDEPDA